VRRLLALLVGGLGVGALLRRRRSQARERERAEAVPSPADELRARLAESRAMAGEREVDEAGETPVAAAPDPSPPNRSPDARRREVHERARQTLDELQ